MLIYLACEQDFDTPVPAEAEAALESKRKTSPEVEMPTRRRNSSLVSTFGGWRPFSSLKLAEEVSELWPEKQETSSTDWSMFFWSKKGVGGRKKGAFKGGANTWGNGDSAGQKILFSGGGAEGLAFIRCSWEKHLRATVVEMSQRLSFFCAVFFFPSWAKFDLVSSPRLLEDSGISRPIKGRLLLQHNEGGGA